MWVTIKGLTNFRTCQIKKRYIYIYLYISIYIYTYIYISKYFPTLLPTKILDLGLIEQPSVREFHRQSQDPQVDIN